MHLVLKPDQTRGWKHEEAEPPCVTGSQGLRARSRSHFAGPAHTGAKKSHSLPNPGVSILFSGLVLSLGVSHTPLTDQRAGTGAWRANVTITLRNEFKL